MRSTRRDRTSAHLRERAGDHGEPGRDDHECADGRQERTSRPSKRRGNAPSREHRDQPDAGDREREPALNAKTSSIPKATRCSEIAASRTTSADGHGSSPPETPTANSERRLGLPRRGDGDGGGARAGCAASARASTEAPTATTIRPETRFEPGIEPVRHDPLRERERHAAEERRRRRCASRS